jgi:hypothetical protein
MRNPLVGVLGFIASLGLVGGAGLAALGVLSVVTAGGGGGGGLYAAFALGFAVGEIILGVLVVWSPAHSPLPCSWVGSHRPR